jgi:hypothetical protein
MLRTRPGDLTMGTLPVLNGRLRYLIGMDADRIKPLPNGKILEVPYDYDKRMGCTQYGNLRDEDDTGKFAPYLPADDITEKYNERTPDPKGPGFMKNVNNQIANAVKLGRIRIELDNPDSRGLSLDAVMQAHDAAWAAGLRTVAKNPHLVDDPTRYILHPSVDLIIIEHGAGGSIMAQVMRVKIGQPLLAVRFVSYDDGAGGEAWAEAVARTIKAEGYRNMGVTHSDVGEYKSSRDIFVPIPGVDTCTS